MNSLKSVFLGTLIVLTIFSSCNEKEELNEVVLEDQAAILPSPIYSCSVGSIVIAEAGVCTDHMVSLTNVGSVVSIAWYYSIDNLQDVHFATTARSDGGSWNFTPLFLPKADLLDIDDVDYTYSLEVKAVATKTDGSTCTAVKTIPLSCAFGPADAIG
ncbi:MAG: hypothetical protein AAGA66_17745 [Bacteroidota bacterium]